VATLLHTGESRQYDLGERTVIGRGDATTIRVLDVLISKQHAEISHDNGRWSIRDLGSSNGTIVNGRRVHALDLSEGDVISLGSAQFVFSLAARSMPVVEIVESVDAPPVSAKLEHRSSEGFRPVAQVTDIEQLKRDYEKLRIANELNRAIGLESDIDRLLSRLLDETFKLLPADRGVILLMDPQSRQLAPRAVKHREPGRTHEAINLSSTIINQVFQSGTSVVTMDAMADQRFSYAQSIIAGGIRSTMCVPMIHQSQLFGIIHIDSLLVMTSFSEKDLQILDGVAAQAAQAVDNAYKAKALERSALARRNFERLLPPEVVEQVVSGNVQLERHGELRPTTVMFTDVRGFTSWSERHTPAHIVSVLNDYFELMVDAIHRHKGTLDKFMGDGIMALFGAPLSSGNDAVNAVDCALEMVRFLAQFNREHESSGDHFSIGIGINTGSVVAGYMGSSKSMEYTAIGDPVNLASRLCAAATPGQILVSSDTLAAVGHRYTSEALPPIKVKGKQHPVNLFQITGYAG